MKPSERPRAVTRGPSGSGAANTTGKRTERHQGGQRLRAVVTPADVALAAMLDESCIDNDVAEARGYRVTSPMALPMITELTGLGFDKYQRGDGILIPLHPIDPDDTATPLCQLRRFKPRADRKTGKPNKYETPAGRTSRLDCNPLMRHAVLDADEPLVITEGVKKVDAAASVGLACIGLFGVENWRNLDHEWNLIPLRGRKVYIAYDSDARTNQNVLRAQDQLTEYLTGLGADVWLIRLPHGAHGAKVGLDDYLAQGHGAADVLALAEHSDVAAVRRRTRDLRIQQEARRELEIVEWERRFKEPDFRTTLAEDLALEEGEVPYLIRPLHVVGGNTLLAAQFKTGKTILSINITYALASGRRFLNSLDVNIGEDHRVGYWNYELDGRQMRSWFRKRQFTADEAANVTLLNLRGQAMPLLTPFGEDWAVKWLHDHGVDTWVVDPFARAFRAAGGRDENVNSEVGPFLDVLDRIKERAEVSNLFLIAHFGRGEQERVRGATVLDDWADSRWIYVRNEEGQRFLSAEGRDVAMSEQHIVFNDEDKSLTLTGEGGRKEKASHRESDDLGAIVAFVAQHPGAKAADIDEACNFHERIGPKRRNKAEAEGLVRVEKEGTSKRYFVA